VSISDARLNGVKLDPAATYLVTANNFLADGGDSFLTFRTVRDSGVPRIDGGNDLEALINYLGTFSPVTPPGTDRANEV
jgi:5'-nucleotidase